MAEKHFKQLGLGSFFGLPIYERVVPRDHFLVQLNRVIDWDRFTEISCRPTRVWRKKGGRRIRR